MLDKSAISMHNAGMGHAQRVQTSGSVCFVRAYAKINLTLDVLGRRADGYHALATVMQTVDLHDTLCLTATDDNRVQVVCTRPELSNEDNLAARAAQLLRERFALQQGILIELRKRIPIAAGLGGGSSDAAAVLLAMRQWCQLSLSPSELQELAASLGSDVPFFLTGGLALCEGRGEQVTPLAASLTNWPSPKPSSTAPRMISSSSVSARSRSRPLCQLHQWCRRELEPRKHRLQLRRRTSSGRRHSTRSTTTESRWSASLTRRGVAPSTRRLS